MIYEFMQNMSKLIYPSDDIYIVDWIDFADNLTFCSKKSSTSKVGDELRPTRT